MKNPAIQAHENADHDGTAIRQFLEHMPIFNLLGFKAVHFEAGRSELELPWRKDLTYDGTTIPAAVSAALMDYAGGAAVATLLPRGWGMMTTGFEVHNIAPAVGQRLLAYGEAISLGKRSGLARADVFVERDGRRTLCATGLVSTKAMPA